jgi:hypothetical protein
MRFKSLVQLPLEYLDVHPCILQFFVSRALLRGGRRFARSIASHGPGCLPPVVASSVRDVRRLRLRRVAFELKSKRL